MTADNKEIGPFCGSKLPDNVISNRSLQIRFSSNSGGGREAGFSITFMHANDQYNLAKNPSE